MRWMPRFRRLVFRRLEAASLCQLVMFRFMMREIGLRAVSDWWPNQAAPVNAPIALWFHVGHPWRRVTEQQRYLAGATVAITLIVTKSFDEGFAETGEQIDADQWLAIVDRDRALTLRTEPYVTRLPNGRELSVPVLPAQSELTVSGERVPFLGYREGALVMRLTEDMESPGNPKRQKVAEVARELGALITHDAG